MENWDDVVYGWALTKTILQFYSSPSPFCFYTYGRGPAIVTDVYAMERTCGNHNNRADLDEPTQCVQLNLRPMRASRVNQTLKDIYNGQKRHSLHGTMDWLFFCYTSIRGFKTHELVFRLAWETLSTQND